MFPVLWTPWVYEHRCWRQELSICRTLQRRYSNWTRPSRPRSWNERISLCSANVYKRYSFRLDLRWKGRQTWHSWSWTAVQLWGCIHEGAPKCWCETAFPRRIPGHAVCLNATRLQEQGCFILDREDMNEKKGLFVMVPMQHQKCTAPHSQSFAKRRRAKWHTFPYSTAAEEWERIRLASGSRTFKSKIRNEHGKG